MLISSLLKIHVRSCQTFPDVISLLMKLVVQIWICSRCFLWIDQFEFAARQSLFNYFRIKSDSLRVLYSGWTLVNVLQYLLFLLLFHFPANFLTVID